MTVQNEDDDLKTSGGRKLFTVESIRVTVIWKGEHYMYKLLWQSV